MDDRNFKDDQLANLSTDDIARASRLLDNELQTKKPIRICPNKCQIRSWLSRISMDLNGYSISERQEPSTQSIKGNMYLLKNLQFLNLPASLVLEKKSVIPIRPATKAECMRDCLRSLRQNHKAKRALRALKGLVRLQALV